MARRKSLKKLRKIADQVLVLDTHHGSFCECCNNNLNKFDKYHLNYSLSVPNYLVP